MVDFHCFVFSIYLRANNEEGRKVMQQSSPAGIEPGTLQFCDAAEPFVCNSLPVLFCFYWNHTIQMTFPLINHLQKHCDDSKASKKQQILTFEDVSLIRDRATICDWFTLRSLQNRFNCNTTDRQYWEWCLCLSTTQLHCGGTISPSVKLHGTPPPPPADHMFEGVFLRLTVMTCCC